MGKNQGNSRYQTGNLPDTEGRLLGRLVVPRVLYSTLKAGCSEVSWIVHSFPSMTK